VFTIRFRYKESFVSNVRVAYSGEIDPCLTLPRYVTRRVASSLCEHVNSYVGGGGGSLAKGCIFARGLRSCLIARMGDRMVVTVIR